MFSQHCFKNEGTLVPYMRKCYKDYLLGKMEQTQKCPLLLKNSLTWSPKFMVLKLLESKNGKRWMKISYLSNPIWIRWTFQASFFTLLSHIFVKFNCHLLVTCLLNFSALPKVMLKHHKNMWLSKRIGLLVTPMVIRNVNFFVIFVDMKLEDQTLLNIIFLPNIALKKQRNWFVKNVSFQQLTQNN